MKAIKWAVAKQATPVNCPFSFEDSGTELKLSLSPAHHIGTKNKKKKPYYETRSDFKFQILYLSRKKEWRNSKQQTALCEMKLRRCWSLSSEISSNNTSWQSQAQPEILKFKCLVWSRWEHALIPEASYSPCFWTANSEDPPKQVIVLRSCLSLGH